MSLEGKIQITLHWDGQRIRDAMLKPRALARIDTLLRGKTPAQATRVIPMLFSLCGQAQAAAAVTALEAAQSGAAPAIPLWRERLVLAEALREHLWRFLLDLPTIMDAPPNLEALMQIRKHFAAACIADSDETAWQAFVTRIEQIVDHTIVGEAAAAHWRACTKIDELMGCLRGSDTVTARIMRDCGGAIGRWGGSEVVLMPDVDGEQVQSVLLPSLQNDLRFALYPHWQEQPAETGALARMRRHPLVASLWQNDGSSILARLAARLYEMAELLKRLRTPALVRPSWVNGAPLEVGTGVAWVQNARGLLLHRVKLDAHGAIEDYRIVAPTEWNFHPAGPCSRGLVGHVAASVDEARHGAELLVHSLDPCVTYQIEVVHA